jgi:hypothetical protein
MVWVLSDFQPTISYHCLIRLLALLFGASENC